MQSFPIAPGSSAGLWLIVGVVVVVLGIVTGVMMTTISGARSSRFEVTDSGLQLRGDFYGRFIPASELKPADARRVDLNATSDLRPRRRSMGTGLPGYQAGWFRLQNGERALVYLTDRRRAVYIPTSAGYALLLSPEDPDAFLAALRSVR
jgi:hypothetical protein